MKPENEFTKPLKVKKDDKQQKGSNSLLIAAGVFFLFALPLFHFYGGFTHVASLFKSEGTKVVYVEKSKDSDEIYSDESDVPNGLPPKTDGNQSQLKDGVERKGNIIRIEPSDPKLPTNQPIKRQEEGNSHLPDPELIERVEVGAIPKKSPDGLRPMDFYSRRPDTEGNFGVARVVLVIGGLGISQTSTQQAIDNFPPTVTLAFAPYGNSLARWMQTARKSGHELLLQIPMEPLDYPSNDPGPQTLRTDVSLPENIANLHWSMSRITNYVGVTNYLGNKLMADPVQLSPIFADLSNRGLLFLDDGSVKNSVAEGVAIKELLPFAKGHVLLDNIRSRSAIDEKLRKLMQEAKRTGLAIGVGNAFPDTIALVTEFTRQAQQNGIEITPLSAAVKDPAK